MHSPPPTPRPKPHTDASIPRRAANQWIVNRRADSLSIQFTTSTEQIRPVRLAIEEFCRDAGFSEKTWSEIGFVINEAVANIIRHAYDATQLSSGTMPIDLTAWLTSNGVVIDLRDWGHGKVPSLAQAVAQMEKDRAAGIVPEPGGLGLACMKQLMNEVEFIPQQPGMVLRLTRIRQP